MTSSFGILSELATEQVAQARLRTPDGLRQAADWVATVASETGAVALVGASRDALVLAGAAGATAGVPVLPAEACAGGPILVVETVLVTGVGVARVLDLLPEAVSPVIVASAAAVGEVPPWLEQSADKILTYDGSAR
jgi:hypothetical protein